MDWLTIGLSVIVIVYLVLISRKSLKIIIPSKTATDIIKLDGIVSSISEEKKKAIDGSLVTLKMPIYECVLDGKKQHIYSMNYFSKIDVGDEVTICYSEEKGVLWAEKDIPLLRRKMIIQIVMSMCLVIVMIAETIIL